MKSHLYRIQIIITVIFFVASIILLSIKSTLYCKTIYINQIKKSHLEQSLNMSKDEILSNYTYILNYLKTSKSIEFNLPSFPSSKEAKFHFKEVKQLFIIIHKLTLISVTLFLILMFKSKANVFLKYSGIILIFLPLIICIPILIDSDLSFNIFHKIFFNNNYWTFDPMKDPVINILPQDFFINCGFLIISSIFISGLIIFKLYKLSS